MMKNMPSVSISPYTVFVNESSRFPSHIHPEIEVVYCIKGAVAITVKDEKYEILAGEAICVGSAVRHSLEDPPYKTEQLVVEIGSLFIGEEFKYLDDARFSAIVYRRTPENSEILACLSEIYSAALNKDKISSLQVKSKLFELFAHILKSAPRSSQEPSEAFNVMRIDNALSLVRQRYFENISVEEAAESCGYGVSAFCSNFKQATGTSFHKYLNHYRLETSKYMLEGTDMSIDEIGTAIGLGGAKCFCRAFRQEFGKTPGEYRAETQK